ncbi:hypothetical protein SSUD9_1774 [Streptococcus suis D9]|nr:hypothetical protein SSUD9_1774 [Streptococcus suis D9]
MSRTWSRLGKRQLFQDWLGFHSPKLARQAFETTFFHA